MRNTRWLYKGKSQKNLNKKYSQDLLSVLESRGINGEENIDKFLSADIKDLRDPFDLKDMEKAVDIIIDIKNNKKNICIYGDYDVDGVTSTSLLYLAFKEIGIDVDYYIPLRDEGYGLNKTAIKEIKDKGADLILTVDCGISSVDEVNYANEIGMDMIITDHHEINNELPKALCVINVKREDNKFSFKSLAGVGTAFMLVLALFEKLGIKEKALKYIDIACIGTVADIVPLIEDNRIIVKNGLKQLRETKWPGLQFLLKKLFKENYGKKYDPYDIGFIIAPVFNAAGRLEDAKKSVELITSFDNKICDVVSYELINQNMERKELQQVIVEKVEKFIEDKKLYDKSVVVAYDKGFHSGIIGIVASKIVDKYYKPTIIMDIKEDGTATGSCRSIEGFNIIEALNSMKDLFVKYGGHAGAAGLTIEVSKINEFEERMNNYAKENIKDEFLLKPVKIDKEISVHKISFDFLEEISLLEPFGFGNQTPLFAIKNAEFKNLRKIGKDKNHLMFNLIKNGVEIKNCVWFGAGDMFNYLAESSLFDIAFKLKMEIFNGKYQYKIFVEDIKQSLEDKEFINIEAINDFEIYDTVFPIKTIFYTRKKITNNLNILFFEDKVYVTEKKLTVGELDEATSYIIRNLKEKFNYNFKINLKDIVENDNNFNVYIDIFRNYEFESYKLKTNELFIDIKKYLIGNLPYNSFQKNILSSVFKSKIKTFAEYKEDRGVGVIIKTIGLYYKSIGKKALLVSDDIENESLRFFIDIESEEKENFDFVIYMNKEMNSYQENSLVLFRENFKENISNIIKDDYRLPNNIEILEEEELLGKKNIWSEKLSRAEKENMLEKYKNGEKIFGTKNILVIL